MVSMRACLSLAFTVRDDGTLGSLYSLNLLTQEINLGEG